ncbi:MAG: arginine--tRNA ligase, partial [Calditrichota bacterium]
MKSLRKKLTDIASSAFEKAGYSATYGNVDVSNRPDLGQFQCNGALPAAKEYKKNPREIAQSVADILSENKIFSSVSLAGPGFINLVLDNAYLGNHLLEVSKDDRYGCHLSANPLTVMV